jgi:PHD/YefM family antitoxin component YafN of YafNO toxin-antitoxin module
MTMRTDTLDEAQRRLVDLADEVETKHDRILLVRSGYPDLALVRADELDAYREWMSFRESEDLANDSLFRPGAAFASSEADRVSAS